MAIVAADTAGRRADRIESLLSARLFLEPQLVDDRITFVSNLSGHLSLYAMDASGGVPEPLLPPQIALQNPELVGGELFHVLAGLGRIVVLIDSDGDENYVPHAIPIDGGFPEPLAEETFAGGRSHLVQVDDATETAYFTVESREEASSTAIRVDLTTGTAEPLWTSAYGAFVAAWTPDHSRVVLVDGYTMGDVVLYEVDDLGARRMLHGTPIEERDPGTDYPLAGFRAAHGTASGAGVLLTTTLYEDTGSLAYLDLSRPEVAPVAIEGLAHDGVGELEGLSHLEGDRYALSFNIDGCSWAYAGAFDEGSHRFSVDRVLVGENELADGVLHGLQYDEGSGRFVASFCTATMPTQLHLLPAEPAASTALTRERALGLAPELLSTGEDASFESHDGLRISARLYLPSEELGFEGARPLVYYVHGGPQSQEQPNFAWFSMPLIQILTLEGFAVFVPNARGSTGYGLAYSKRVDRDWGGLDRLDHVHAMTEVLPHDERVDVSRAGVVGRSYGGYMTLTLAARHPNLWRAAVDMFGPYDLFTFMDRLPETWKPYFALAVGDPERDRDFLTERSPKTHIEGISCPLLVIQGQNDPRVVERESRDVVEQLRGLGRDVDYLVFEDEGHDVLKLANRVRCYDAIVGFFEQHLS
ncbi:MAG TPA: prolyl oligopeptidase family serine peptidase [Gaiellaceae bacterium]|nr:prolyl oligopeptidase family serine peptidase [Gaiellaceae bacterium]